MDALDSIGAQAPDLGPGLPVYPALNSFVRVSGPSIGSNIYPGFAQQPTTIAGLPAFRDREPVYIWEPNGITLQQGYYDARLMTSYIDRPLYATNCCVTQPFSSSSMSSSAGACVLGRTALGTTTDSSGSASFTLTNITVPVGSMLLVGGAGSFASAPGTLVTGTFAGNSMTRRLVSVNSLDDPNSWNEAVFFHYLPGSTTTGNVTITWTISPVNSAMWASCVTCLTVANGTAASGVTFGTTPSCSPTIGAANGYAGVTITRSAVAGGDSIGTWTGGIWQTGQTASIGTGTFALSIEEAFYLNPPTGALTTGKTGQTSRLTTIECSPYGR